MRKILTITAVAVLAVACDTEKTSDTPRPVKPESVVTVAPDRADTHTSRTIAAAPKTLPWKPSKPPLHTPKKKPSPAPQTPAKPSPAAQKPKVTVIGSYASCPTAPQRCIDNGSLTLYAGSKILGGHDYMGYAYLAQLPVGRTVKVTSGAVAGTYRVVSHQYLGRQGGSIPGFIYSADLSLQSCQGSGTAFSLLKKVA